MAKKKQPAAAAPAGATKQEDGPQDMHVIFVGTGETPTGKLAARVIPLAKFAEVKGMSQPMLHQAASLFEVKKSEMPRQIGGVYRVKGTLGDDGRIMRMIPTLTWSGEESPVPAAQRVEIATQVKALEITRRMERQHAEVGRADLIKERLEPLRRLWLQTDTPGRLAVEALVLHSLRGGQ